jgi:hypothetical protein
MFIQLLLNSQLRSRETTKREGIQMKQSTFLKKNSAVLTTLVAKHPKLELLINAFKSLSAKIADAGNYAKKRDKVLKFQIKARLDRIIKQGTNNTANVVQIFTSTECQLLIKQVAA